MAATVEDAAAALGDIEVAELRPDAAEWFPVPAPSAAAPSTPGGSPTVQRKNGETNGGRKITIVERGPRAAPPGYPGGAYFVPAGVRYVPPGFVAAGYTGGYMNMNMSARPAWRAVDVGGYGQPPPLYVAPVVPTAYMVRPGFRAPWPPGWRGQQKVSPRVATGRSSGSSDDHEAEAAWAEGEPTPKGPGGSEENARASYAHSGRTALEERPISANQIFCSNLPWSVNGKMLRQAFEVFGEVTDAFVAYHGRSSRGFGYVTFKEPADARGAVEAMNIAGYVHRWPSGVATSNGVHGRPPSLVSPLRRPTPRACPFRRREAANHARRARAGQTKRQAAAGTGLCAGARRCVWKPIVGTLDILPLATRIGARRGEAVHLLRALRRGDLRFLPRPQPAAGQCDRHLCCASGCAVGAQHLRIGARGLRHRGQAVQN